MIIHGRNIVLLANGVAIAASKSCTMNVSADIIKVASPSDGQWEHAIAGRKSWDASCSQLVTNITDGLSMIGTQVTLRMQVKGEFGLPFEDFETHNPSLENYQLTEEPTNILWDTTRKQFIALLITEDFEDLYFSIWPGAAQYTQLGYYYQRASKRVYRKTATNLIPEALQGSAIVKDWKITATLGNLSQGSFQFHGVGPLVNPTS